MPGVPILLFLLSGAAALCYESVWSRYLGLFVGHSGYAQVIVLVIFLGGMAIGAMLVAGRSQRLGDPLIGYALAEAAIGCLGLVFHDVYLAVTGWAYATVFPATAGSPLLPVARWGIAALLILPQSILLGATFPLMSAGVLRRVTGDPGRTLSLLYFANSLGGSVGVLLAGFYLVQAAGLPGTVLAAVILNLLVAIGAIVASRRWRVDGARVPAVATPATAPPPTAVPNRLLLWATLVTAAASLIYEVVWLRMLALVLSSATHAFELMLSAFILGLALGSYWIRTRADHLKRPLHTLAVVQLVMGMLALATVPLYFQAFHWTAAIMQAFARTEAGYTGFNLARYGICLLVMLPATFCAGITLPLITRVLVAGGTGERAIGQVYGWNTVGSILGVILAALALLPILGLKGLLVFGAMLDMAVGVVILAVIARGEPGARGTVRLAAVAWVVVLAAALLSPAFDQRLLLSGVYRFGVLPAPGSRDVLYYSDGRTATVSAERIRESGDLFIATNGKSDGGLPAYWLTPCSDSAARNPLRHDAATQALLALITLAHQPEARIGAVIGQGTGMTSHLLLGSRDLEALYTIEIEPEMLRASHVFYPANRRAFDDPRSHIIIDDARSYFAAAGRRYDFILSEPSNPWVSGVSGLFTSEFYGQAKRYLRPGGIFAQWMHTYDMDDRLVMTVLSALRRQFDNYEIFMPAPSDILIVATEGAGELTADWSVLQLPGIAADLCHQVPIPPEAMEATRLGGRATLDPLIARFPLTNSDFFPHLDLGAERTRYLARQAPGMYGLSAERFDLTAPFGGRRIAPAHFDRAPAPEIPRVADLARGAALRRPPTAGEDDALRLAREREHAWRVELAAAEPPADWRGWLQRMAEIERDRYGGTKGYVDESFYAEIGRYLDRWKPPAPVRAAIEFRRGTLGWDFPRAVRAADPLLAGARNHILWIPADELRDGAVVAWLMMGNAARAREIFELLAPASGRPAGDFRTALLSAYVQARFGDAP